MLANFGVGELGRFRNKRHVIRQKYAIFLHEIVTPQKLDASLAKNLLVQFNV